MIEHNAFAHNACGVDVDAEDFRVSTLDKECQFLAILLPQVVSEPVYLDGLKSLEVQDYRQIGIDGSVALIDGHDVSSGMFYALGAGFEGIIKQFPHGYCGHYIV